MSRNIEKLIHGASPTMINVMNIVRKIAPTDANVLITGENGTGKELIAREIHNQSSRSGELMVSVDMGSVTESLFESELFGHVKGAFTDAAFDRKGKMELASGSTLFLDEIGNLSLHTQAKLLKVLQSRTITRVGANKEIPINIRVVAATNRNLSKMVEEGSFREDLLYRINTIVIDVPPLRDRVDDIPVLVSYFTKFYCEKYNRSLLKISSSAMEKLTGYSWPGNVRELQHAIEKSVIMNESGSLLPIDFDFKIRHQPHNLKDMTLAEMEEKYILDTLKRNGNNISVTANILGITRQTLYNKLKVINDRLG